MSLTSSSRTGLFAAVVILGLLSLALLLLWLRPMSGTVDLRLTEIRQSTNSALLVTVVLTNGTSRILNVVDDADGNPAFILDTGRDSDTWLTRMVNQLKINLIPGGSLTNTVLITNAPSRLRLKVPLRDFAAERRDWTGAVLRLRPRRLAEQLGWQRDELLPTSAWIEITTPQR